MARRPEEIVTREAYDRLVSLVTNFEKELKRDDLRDKVRSLIPVSQALKDLGSSLIPLADAPSARNRILYYLLKYPAQVIATEELMIVAGIIDYQRRIRELRREKGWKILSGETAKEMLADPEDVEPEWQEMFKAMKPDDYIMVDTQPDVEAAERWHIANRIRRMDVGTRERILAYLRENVGRQVFGEELAYVAENASNWPRRTRELRTEYGWPVSTKTSGRPDLPVGVYVLEEDRQAPEHDRQIPDAVRRSVLRRDGYRCRNCGWHHGMWNRSDPRHLEVHHIQQHSQKGQNVEANLITLCKVCHDEVHAGRLEL